MQTVTNIQNYLYKLIEMEEETGNHCKAEEIAEITEHMVLLFDLWDYGKVVPYLLIAVYRKDDRKMYSVDKRSADGVTEAMEDGGITFILQICGYST